MSIKQGLKLDSGILKGHVNRYAFIGLLISIGSIIFASCLVSYQMTGAVTLKGIYLAHISNPGIWALDITPFMFAYWGQAFCYGLAEKAESILEHKETEYLAKSKNLTLELKYESNHDSLTLLPNRQLFNEKISQSIEEYSGDYKFAIIIINLNDFKNINYNFGLYNGNNILKQFAEKLKSLLLEPLLVNSYMGMNIAARLESDKFGVLLPRIEPSADINSAIKNIRELTSTDFMLDGLNIHLTTTLGVALYPGYGKTAEELIHQAYVSLYSAERINKSYAVYKSDMKETYTQTHLLVDELKHALEHETLDVKYQPYIHLNTRRIVGVEAFVQLTSERLGNIRGDKIIPLIEGTNLNDILTRFVIKTSIKDLAYWHKKGYVIDMNINLSASDATDPELPPLIGKTLKENQIDPKYFGVELSERACLNNQNATYDILSKLSLMGISITIDDFCSGYSSFIYLNYFPINKVKINTALISNMLEDEKKMNIVRAMICIAKNLKLQLQAIGINSSKVKEKLIKMGCQFGQGFYYSKSTSREELEVLFNSDFILPDEEVKEGK